MTRQEKATCAALQALKGTFGWELVVGTLKKELNNSIPERRAKEMLQQCLRDHMKSSFGAGIRNGAYFWDDVDFNFLIKVAAGG